MDPLKRLLSIHPLDLEGIEQVVHGNLYLAIELKNGEIGVCATLGEETMPFLFTSSNLDLDCPAHRIHLIAYYNALFNSGVIPDAKEDIFTHLNFRTAGDIVMIGYFRPLVKKFDALHIPLRIFDLKNDDARLTPYSLLESTLPLADTVIITSTTLVNNTFEQIAGLLKPGARAYMLGPTTIMHPVMFSFPQLKALYGMAIHPADQKVLDIIASHGGTPEFSPFAQKICLLRK
jgi:uncharacterized protein (DUF4213/DUF364 family)